MRTRIKPDGRLAYELMYFGASQTGRWSGGGGWNAQNMNRAGCEGVDIRRLIVPPPGQRFIIADYAQIEARVTLFLAGDNTTLDRVREGESVYEAHARATMGFAGRSLKQENPALYALAKARVLGLGFGCGADRFIAVAKMLAGLDLDHAEAVRIVREFRDTNKRIVRRWFHHEENFRACDGGTYFLYLPSGRYLRYFNVNGASMTAATKRGETPEKIFGGRMLENEVQATARDIMAAAWLRLTMANFYVALTVHDEFVIEIPESGAVAAEAAIARILTEPPSWAAGLPLSVSTHIAQEYGK
ncbi:MAG: DNA polymerase [Kiritimatiellaeota bacterium]|nr:DNA polymerase [Kiritimatiellota bacterium]